MLICREPALEVAAQCRDFQPKTPEHPLESARFAFANHGVCEVEKPPTLN
jgi:hypothetical protein